MMKIPDKPRVHRCIKKAMEFILQEEICWLPVDTHELIGHVAKEHKTVGDMSKKLGISRDLIIDGKDADVFYWNGIYKIVFNERVEPRERLRWTLMHEIGHIVLGHLADFQSTTLSARLTDKDYRVLEREADIFAIEVLAPFFVLHEMKIHYWKHIKDMCKISEQAARLREKEILRMGTTKIYEPFQHRILLQFERYIKSIQPFHYY